MRSDKERVSDLDESSAKAPNSELEPIRPLFSTYLDVASRREGTILDAMTRMVSPSR